MQTEAEVASSVRRKKMACVLVLLLMLRKRKKEREREIRPPKRRLQECQRIDWLAAMNTYEYQIVFGVNKTTFDLMYSTTAPFIRTARNVRAKHSEEENEMRRVRGTTLSTKQRFALWMEQMKHGLGVEYVAVKYQWNAASVSDDFCHITEAFVRAMGVWIAPLTDEQKALCRGMIPGFPRVIASLDGKQFVHRRLSPLPLGTGRGDHFGHKHKHDCDNSQAEVAICGGFCTELLTGVLGATPDNTAARMMRGTYDNTYETLVDDGYRNVVGGPKFVPPLADGTEAGQTVKNARAKVEHYFARVSEWKLVGVWYTRGKAMHPLCQNTG